MRGAFNMGAKGSVEAAKINAQNWSNLEVTVQIPSVITISYFPFGTFTNY